MNNADLDALVTAVKWRCEPPADAELTQTFVNNASNGKPFLGQEFQLSDGKLWGRWEPLGWDAAEVLRNPDYGPVLCSCGEPCSFSHGLCDACEAFAATFEEAS